MRLRIDPGIAAVTILVWSPAWLIAGAVIGGRFGLFAIFASIAPLILWVLSLWAMMVITIRHFEHLAFAVFLGIPVLIWMLGRTIGAYAVAASVALWLASRAIAALVQRRQVMRRPQEASYTGGLLIAPRRPRPDHPEPR